MLPLSPHIAIPHATFPLPFNCSLCSFQQGEMFVCWLNNNAILIWNSPWQEQGSYVQQHCNQLLHEVDYCQLYRASKHKCKIIQLLETWINNRNCWKKKAIKKNTAGIGLNLRNVVSISAQRSFNNTRSGEILRCWERERGGGNKRDGGLWNVGTRDKTTRDENAAQKKVVIEIER